MIYIDTSCVLAQLLAEDRAPPRSLWEQPLVTSRLLEYEVWNRIHAKGLTATHAEATTLLLGRLGFLSLVDNVIARAREEFPAPVRTLDALHLASIEFLRSRRQSVALATYDIRMLDAAKAMGIPVVQDL